MTKGNPRKPDRKYLEKKEIDDGVFSRWVGAAPSTGWGVQVGPRGELDPKMTPHWPSCYGASTKLDLRSSFTPPVRR